MWEADPIPFEARWVGWLRTTACTVFTMGAGLFCLLAVILPLAASGTPLLLVALFLSACSLAYAMSHWILALYLAPRYAMTLAVSIVATACLILPLPCWLLASREASRNTHCMNNLRVVGSEMLYEDGRARPADYPYGASQQAISEYIVDPQAEDVLQLLAPDQPAYEP